jgi:hypothetical protein
LEQGGKPLKLLLNFVHAIVGTKSTSHSGRYCPYIFISSPSAACSLGIPPLPNWQELVFPDAVLPQAVLSPISGERCSARKGDTLMRLLTRRILTRPLAVAVLTGAWLLSVPQISVPKANAQAQSPSSGLSNHSPNIPDQKLDAAVAAMERVVSLKQNYQQQIAAAPPSEQERIAAEATNALAKAVTDQGLSVEEYDSILEVAQNDPQVGEKIRQRLPPSVK